MSFAQPAKESVLMLKLVEELKERLPSYFYTQTIDSNGYPTLLISQSSTPTAGQNNAFIRFYPFPTPMVDSINSPQGVWTPLLCQIVEEASSISGVAVLSAAFAANLNQCIFNQGVINQWYLRANGTVPSASDIIPGNLVAQTSADAYYPLSGQ